jgi:tripartite-type tricarboxylate transporter receptor subunit TctC
MSSSGMRVTQCGVTGLAVLIGAALVGADAAEAQSGAAPYAGKQIRMVVASGAGGGYDAYARVLARHIGRHIAGNPSIISQNMPGAAGLTATNWAYSVAPKDGSVIVATYNALIPEPLYNNPAARFDMLKFGIVGSIGKQQNVCGVWHTSSITSIEQAKTRELTVAATGTTGDTAIMPKILNAFVGTKFKIIAGYGTTEQRLAVERGEVDGVCGLSWSTLKASNPEWTEKHRLNVLIQMGDKAQADLPKVPLLIDLVATPDDKKVIELLSFHQEMGRPFLMPPGTPKDMVTAVRRAFDATMKDPQFLAEAHKANLEVDPLTGEEMEAVIRRAYATPKALVQRAAPFSSSAGQ